MTDLRSAVVRLLNEVHDLRLEGNNPSLRAALADVRDALAHPAPPAEGEVGELVRWLRSRAGIPASPDFPAVAAMLTRAALAQPEPEVVGPSADELWDIGERHLWTGTDESVTNDRILTSFIGAARAVLSRWGRPAHALPLPAGEVQP